MSRDLREFSKINIMFIFYFILVASCHAETNPEKLVYLTNVQLNKKKLHLYLEGSKCTIKFEGKSNSINLDIPYPCGFVQKTIKKGAQTHFYKGIGHVYVVAGPLAEVESYKKNGSVKPKHKCSNWGQAIIIDGIKIKVRPSKKISLGFCHYLGFDEKVFYGYAYPVTVR